ncbi:MAG: DinB family protein [Sciscionella sp.]|nr:DinB family protein [Sciscionella sp.]
MTMTDSGDAGERALLEEYLDHFRGEITRKLAGVSDADARRRLVPSLTTLAGVVKHLRWVEAYWFQRVLADTPAQRLPAQLRIDADPDDDWRLADDDTVAGLIADYDAECARSRETAARYDLGAVGMHGGRRAQREPESITLREILLHMIEETARHAGHADILRELIDGSIGD